MNCGVRRRGFRLRRGQSYRHVALWVERDDADRCPVAGLAAPAARVRATCLLIEFVPPGQKRTILAGMALRRGDVADAAMAMLFVVPTDEARGPLPGSIKSGEPFGRELWAVFCGAEQRLGKRIVVADTGTRVGRLDTKPIEHGEHARSLQRRAVVTVQHWLARHGVHTFRQGGALDEMRGVIGTVARVDLEADHLPAVEVQDHVEIEPPSQDLCWQEGHIPTPHFAWSGGNVCRWWTRRPRGTRPATPTHLTMNAQHPMEAGLTGNVDAFIGQCRDDPCRRGLGEAWFVRPVTIRARSAALKACDGVGRTAWGRRSPWNMPSPAR